MQSWFSAKRRYVEGRKPPFSLVKSYHTFIKAIVRNFYVSVNIRFTQATTRGDDTTLIKPFGSFNTLQYFSVFVLFVFTILEQLSRAGGQERPKECVLLGFT